MERLYRYFLWLIKQGAKLFDAIAAAAMKFPDTPAKEMYNVAVSAFASRAAGQWMAEHPQSPFANLINQQPNTTLTYGINYTYEQLLELFPTLVGAPYQFIGSSYIESATISNYRTYSTYVSDDSYYHKIIEVAGQLWDFKYKLVDGRLVFISKFIVGRPILVDY